MQYRVVQIQSYNSVWLRAFFYTHEKNFEFYGIKNVNNVSKNMLNGVNIFINLYLILLPNWYMIDFSETLSTNILEFSKKKKLIKFMWDINIKLGNGIWTKSQKIKKIILNILYFKTSRDIFLLSFFLEIR